jgi:gliding motility-associated lipoprotein GldD
MHCRKSFLRTQKVILFLGIVVFCACGDSDPQPKPYGYFRIDFPEKTYQEFQNERFSFRCPEYATAIVDPLDNHNKDWLDVAFPAFNAKIHLSYHPVKHNFDTLAEDARALAMKHIQKASGINQTLIERDDAHVYGMIYDIAGVGTASSCQFFLSDTTTNFLRGALYFNVTPNNDSLAPVINFIRQDIDTLIHTLQWTKH